MPEKNAIHTALQRKGVVRESFVENFRFTLSSIPKMNGAHDGSLIQHEFKK